MPEEKITLDKDVFKTLASGTRVDILKSLDRRRKTLSELSKQLGLSVSTIKEHLDNLVSVGLIEQKDEGHKWKYYELTKKGKDILHPEDKRVWILLGVAAVGIVFTGIDLLRAVFGTGVMLASQTFAEKGDAIMRSMEASEDLVGGGAAAPAAVNTIPELPYLHIAGLVIFGIIMAVSIIYVLKVRNEIRI